MSTHIVAGTEIEASRASFATDGFYIARGLLKRDATHRCRQQIQSVFNNQLLHLDLAPSNDLFSDALALHDADITRYKKTLASLWRLQAIGALFNDIRIQQFLEDVLGFGPVFVPGGQTVHVQSEELKIPGGYFGLKAHQDWPSVQGSLDGVGVWIPLSNIDMNGFPLEVARGSHLAGLMEPAGSNYDSIWQVDTCSDSDFEGLCVEQDDVVFFSNFLVHRSGLNGRANFMRIACSSRFDNGGEPSFISRAQPSAYIRSVNRGLMDYPDIAAVNRELLASECCEFSRPAFHVEAT